MIHIDPARRDEAIAAVGRSIGCPLSLPSDWDAFAVVKDGSVVGGVLKKGREVHIGVNGPVYLRGIIRAFFQPDLVTVVREANAAGCKFVRRLGFVEVGRKDGLVHYEMKDAKHV